MSEAHDQQRLSGLEEATLVGQPHPERNSVDGTAPLGAWSPQVPTAADGEAAMERALPADQHEVDLKAARQLLPALLRLAARRLSARPDSPADLPHHMERT